MTGAEVENYIVRIYRRDIADPNGIVGLVEMVEREETVAFHSIFELLEILTMPCRLEVRSEYPAELLKA
jgi:hypothetical protein